MQGADSDPRLFLCREGLGTGDFARSLYVMKTLSLSVLLLASFAFVAGCSPAKKETEQESSEPQTPFGRALRQAEEVQALASRTSVQVWQVFEASAREAREKLATLNREEFNEWLAEQRGTWAARSQTLQDFVIRHGVQAEPAVRAAIERVAQARAAVERKAAEFRTTAESEWPRLREELRGLLSTLNEAEAEAEKAAGEAI